MILEVSHPNNENYWSKKCQTGAEMGRRVHGDPAVCCCNPFMNSKGATVKHLRKPTSRCFPIFLWPSSGCFSPFVLECFVTLRFSQKRRKSNTGIPAVSTNGWLGFVLVVPQESLNERELPSRSLTFLPLKNDGTGRRSFPIGFR